MSFIYNSEISGVRFSLSGTEDIIKESHVQILTHDLFRGSVPYTGGVYDPHLGTVDYTYKCQTCDLSKKHCLGHPGHVVLNYPVWNVIAFTDTKRWLKIICFNCGHIVVPPDVYQKIPIHKRFIELSKHPHTKKCQNCGTAHPRIRKDKQSSFAIIGEIMEDKRVTHKFVVYPHIAATVFSRVTDQTVMSVGKNVANHPSKNVLHAIQAPPITIRPDMRKIGDAGRSINNDVTTMLQLILKQNNILPKVIPNIIEPKLEKSILDLSYALGEMVRGANTNPKESLATRLRSKEGRFRKNLMGKRVRNMCRSTITGEPRLQIDQVGLPISFARTVQCEETVQEYNRLRMTELVMNGRKRYPGATKVIKKNSGREYDTEMAKDLILENGDIVIRDLIDGDVVNFNRQPSLLTSNIACHRVVVIMDPSILTLQMNVIACSLNFNGYCIVGGKQEAADVVDQHTISGQQCKLI